MYGAQTTSSQYEQTNKFENDVEMYGAQTKVLTRCITFEFENDVEMYGAQTLQKQGRAR